MKELWKQMLAVIFVAIAVCLAMGAFHYVLNGGKDDDKPEMRIIEADGHEYIIMTFSSFPEGRCVAHKADCRFCKKEHNHE